MFDESLINVFRVEIRSRETSGKVLREVRLTFVAQHKSPDKGFVLSRVTMILCVRVDGPKNTRWCHTVWIRAVTVGSFFGWIYSLYLSHFMRSHQNS